MLPNRSHLQFRSLHELAAFTRRLLSGFLIDTSHITVTAAFSKREIEVARNIYGGVVAIA
ncbi:hypothetical protein [Flaviaesturariibacter amylovorans]|uniref:hypothetical protein n=1 Tax=Flaviaesturariibacter amylovorans TaxID=1084520 RepID=UPI0031EAED4B